jgi:hypothetical protein
MPQIFAARSRSVVITFSADFVTTIEEANSIAGRATRRASCRRVLHWLAVDRGGNMQPGHRLKALGRAAPR